ncbi:MerR family transcriptional regulator [Streptomyces sp. 796.1]|uniref:MerR family transcriptional regulator n=1 Tax=Streptomyces sp. 796.1 TaxID=3163029 RepID=UPI0039C8F5A2
MNQASGDGREYRVAELGRAAGVKVRNLRYYQGRGLLPPPRYVGRVALYSEAHLARLRLISDLLARGYTVKGIAELFAASDRGSCVAEFLGFEEHFTEQQPARAGPTDAPVVTCRAELRERFGDQLTDETLHRAAELGYLTVDGETITHPSRQLLDRTEELVRSGVPLAALLTVSALVRDHTTELAEHLASAVRTHLIDGDGGSDTADSGDRGSEGDGGGRGDGADGSARTGTGAPGSAVTTAGPGDAPDATPGADPRDSATHGAPGRHPRVPAAGRVASAMATLRPLAGELVRAEFARAMGLQVAAERAHHAPTATQAPIPAATPHEHKAPPTGPTGKGPARTTAQATAADPADGTDTSTPAEPPRGTDPEPDAD